MIGGLYEARNLNILFDSIITRYDLREGFHDNLCEVIEIMAS